ncbi:MAG TPA: carboxypeptidase-like regulatory domain-containing protein [Candidatus Dormibacteraeota bacterium]|nr:carboxypeptidase-like regulatory domain-containing protein [Candidatus Dormibacteraeota bacterium]
MAQRFRIVAILTLVLALANNTLAQTGTGILRGQVTDPSASAVSGATVLVITPANQSLTTTTSRDGLYEVKGLASGKYTVKVIAEGFAQYVNENVSISTGQAQKLNIALSIAVQQEKVEVAEQPAAVNVNPNNNAGAIVLSGKDLDALSDDPDDLQSDLQALAGPSAGPNGGQIYIDGFTGGQLPPKSSIREIRINQNPFSAEFDRLGYGRIEIFTKPGTDKLHGQFFVNGNSSAFNSRSPFAHQNPGYYTTFFSGNVAGAITKRASFFFSAERRNINETSVVSAVILDPAFNPIPFSDVVANPRKRTELSPRFDFQLTKSNTLTLRYQLEHSDDINNGVGQFSLASQGFNQADSEQNFQASDTQIIGAKIVNETRFRYTHQTTTDIVRTFQPTISVLDAFTGGGSGRGSSGDSQKRYELQNYTSMALGKNFVKFGGRLRASRNVNNSMSNFNGNFTFGSRPRSACKAGDPCADITSLESYRITVQGLANGLPPDQIIAAGGGPSQFSITTGQPLASVTMYDAGLYVQDDFRLRPNITVSAGLRFETQNDIQDHADIAPRLGIAWGIGPGKNSSPKTVLRAGYGIFYDRFGQDLVLQAERLNGTTTQQHLFTNRTPSEALTALNYFINPPKPNDPLAGSLGTPTIRRVSPQLHAPYTLQTAVSLERQLSRAANISVSYLNARGVHMLVSQNINAPLPITGVRPFGNIGNIYEFESAGVFRQNQLMINGNIRNGARFSLFGFYSLSYANSDTAGAGSFPSNPYNLAADYGRAAFDVRHRVFLGGSISLPYGVRASPFVVIQSGSPFNITIGRDLNGDSIFNDRPAFATDLTRPTVVNNRYGSFDLAPRIGQAIIPINMGNGPARTTVNLRVAKTFGFGKKAEAIAQGGPEGGLRIGPGGPGGGGEHREGGGGRGGFFGGGGGGGANSRYSLTFSVSARNLFNKTNLANPIGNLTSPLFGESNALAGGPFGSSSANRRVDLQAVFNF